jgi:intracellular sulfur oxidation DsrE/DsrF family protein
MKQLCFFILAAVATLSGQAQDKVNPVVQSFGSVYDVKFAKERPDSKMDYKILVDITDAADKPDSLNAYLEAAATLLNLHGVGGVPAKNLHMVVVFHKMATYSIFTNEMYQQKFKMDNPNLPLIAALKNAGVQFYTYGQTLMKRNISEKSIVPEVEVATSALTTLTTYQLKGYAMINFK